MKPNPYNKGQSRQPHQRAESSSSRVIFHVSRELPDTKILQEVSKLYYPISHEEILACDTSRIIENFGPTINPKVGKKLMGNVMFAVCGYDDVDLHIFFIPEIYKFYAEIQRKHPFWLFYSELDSPTLLMIWACVLNDKLNGKYNQNDERAGLYKPILIEFLGECMPAFLAHAKRCGLSEREQKARIKKVTMYFKNPQMGNTRG